VGTAVLHAGDCSQSWFEFLGTAASEMAAQGSKV